MTTVIEIVKKYLVEHKLDGLVHQDTGCGCSVDDLAPCNECPVDEFEAAVRVPCSDGERCNHDGPTSDGYHFEPADEP